MLIPRSTTIAALLTVAACAGTIEPGEARAPAGSPSSRPTTTVDPVGPPTDPPIVPTTADAGEVARDGGAVRAAPAAAPVDAPRLTRSAGCGVAASGNDEFATESVRIGERDRTWYLRVPRGYEAQRAYPLVFRWHGRGGNGLSGGLAIEEAAGDRAIVVAADGLDTTWTPATQADDLSLFDTMLATVSARYCIDLTRVFSYGFSAGGGLTNLLGCKRADKLRATAAIAGFDRADASCDGTRVAAWYQHDQGDPAVPISQGTGARARSLRRNGCSEATTEMGGCLHYAGCRSGYPVVWCETSGLGHDIAGATAPSAVWAFFSSLP